MNKSKKIIMAGMIALQSLGAIAAPAQMAIEEFSSPKAEYVQVIESKDLFPEVKEEQGINYVLNINTGVKLPLNQVMNDEISGAYKHPFNENGIMVISFQDSDTLSQDHEQIKKDLDDHGILSNKKYQMHILKQMVNKNSNQGSYQDTEYESGIDYNFISISTAQIKKIQEKNILNGYEDINDMIPELVLYHEMAHSHDNQSVKYESFLEDLKTNYTEDEMYSDEAQEKVVDKFKELRLEGENYADSNMLLNLAKTKKNYNSETYLSKINKLAEYMLNDFREDGVVKKDFDPHMSKATVKTTIDFINNNSENIEKFDYEDFKSIAENISSETLGHKDISKYVKNFEGQKEIAELGGLQNEIIQQVADKVNGDISKMINIYVNAEGETKYNFNSPSDNMSKDLKSSSYKI
jgi:hypothetical protein